MKKQVIKLSELRNLIKEELAKGKKVIKEYTSNDKFINFKDFVIDNISFENYSDINETSDKIIQAYEIYLSETGNGKNKDLESYRRGLPSWFDGPYNDYDIKNLLYSLGFDEVENMNEEKVANMYWKLLSRIFYSSVKKLRHSLREGNENKDKSTRGSELAMNYILKIRKDFKIKKFTDDEVEDFTKYLKNELGL